MMRRRLNKPYGLSQMSAEERATQPMK